MNLSKGAQQSSLSAFVSKATLAVALAQINVVLFLSCCLKIKPCGLKHKFLLEKKNNEKRVQYNWLVTCLLLFICVALCDCR